MALGLLLGVLCIVAANAVAPRIRVAAPLVLVLVGVGVSVQPLVEVPPIVVEPHLILGGVLPLLLFAAAVSMPAVNFRRNFGAIAGLSVTLVLLTSLALGLVFSAILPELGFAGGVALGAVISPTDAVATSIVKRLGVAPRVVAVLDGEAMLNDASALVVLRTAVGAIGAASTSIGGAVGSFFVSILIATEEAKRALDERENRTVARLQSRVRRALADADYHAARPLGYRDAALLVWAGMRGAITLAAAQTLPEDFPYRSLAVLVAFFVAVASLVIQGGTIGWVVRTLRFPPPLDTTREQEALIAEIQQAGAKVLESPASRATYGDEMVAMMLQRLDAWRDGRAFVKSGEIMDQVFDAQRLHVLRARREGNYSTETLETALRRIDAMQIGLGLTRRGGLDDE